MCGSMGSHVQCSLALVGAVWYWCFYTKYLFFCSVNLELHYHLSRMWVRIYCESCRHQSTKRNHFLSCLNIFINGAMVQSYLSVYMCVLCVHKNWITEISRWWDKNGVCLLDLMVGANLRLLLLLWRGLRCVIRRMEIFLSFFFLVVAAQVQPNQI